jgi:hypothetical protein
MVTGRGERLRACRGPLADAGRAAESHGADGSRASRRAAGKNRMINRKRRLMV